MATVNLPRSLVTLFPDAPPRRLEMPAESVDELLDRLDERWPGFRDRVCADRRSLRQHINLYVDGERASLQTTIGGSSVVHILPAVAGG